ncbi:MAG: alpha/beta hydrolase, partial [Pseudomonadota bacterium]
LPLPLRQEEDIKKHFMEYATKELTVDAFKAEIKSAAKNNSSALVYIHGFNNSFQQAMFRAAQLGEDLSFDGHVFAYSWPARGGVRNYLTDMDSARLAVTHFDVFLDRIVENTGIETLHVIAHSMGNAVFSSLVERGGTKFSKRPGKFINQLILAAPDIDREVFEELAGLFRAQSEEVTLYASSRDMALQASETLHASYPRAGDVPGIGPLVIPGIDTMDVSAVETGLFSLKHNSHSDTDQVLNDVMARINGAGVPPDKRITNVRRVPHALGMHYFRFDPVKR